MSIDQPRYAVQTGRLITKDGKPFLLIAIPAAFFTNAPSASPAQADRLVSRIAELFENYGDGED